MKGKLIIIMAAFSIQAHAQEVSLGSYKIADDMQLWRQTNNAAGISLDSSANRGIAYFDFSHTGGDLHRVQDGGINNKLQFITERYQKVGKYLYGYGSFKFDMGRTKDRAWSDVIRSYNSNPFISGSSVKGKYDNQDFEMNASLASIPLGHFTYGANLFYKTGDLSRLRDPRSRINLAQYRLTPAITYSFGNNTLGLAAHYDRRKEKLAGLTTVQTDPNLKYYVMTGLEQATGTIGGYQGYMREYVNHEFGMELDYSIKTSALQSLNSITFAHGTEYIYGTNKYEPGRYFNNKYGFATRNRLQTGRLLHSADISLSYIEAYADEFRQERISETDAVTGFTSVTWQTVLTYKKRVQMKKTDLSLHYRCNFAEAEAAATKGYVGLLADMECVNNKRLLNTSEQKYAYTQLLMEGGLPLVNEKLWIEAKAGYHFSNKAELALADETTDYAQAVLLPDNEILGKNSFVGSMKLTCQLPITIQKFTRNWFISAYGNYRSANSDLNRWQIGCLLGLYY